MTIKPNQEEIAKNVETLASSAKVFADTLPEMTARLKSVEKIPDVADKLEALRKVVDEHFSLTTASFDVLRRTNVSLNEKLGEETKRILNLNAQLKDDHNEKLASINGTIEVLNGAIEALRMEIGNINTQIRLIFPSIQTNSESFRQSTEAYAKSADLIQQNIRSLATLDSVKILLAETEQKMASKSDIQDLRLNIKEDINQLREQLKSNQNKEFWAIFLSAFAIIGALIWATFQISSSLNPIQVQPDQEEQVIPRNGDS